MQVFFFLGGWQQKEANCRKRKRKKEEKRGKKLNRFRSFELHTHTISTLSTTTMLKWLFFFASVFFSIVAALCSFELLRVDNLLLHFFFTGFVACLFLNKYTVFFFTNLANTFLLRNHHLMMCHMAILNMETKQQPNKRRVQWVSIFRIYI